MPMLGVGRTNAVQFGVFAAFLVAAVVIFPTVQNLLIDRDNPGNAPLYPVIAIVDRPTIKMLVQLAQTRGIFHRVDMPVAARGSRAIPV